MSAIVQAVNMTELVNRAAALLDVPINENSIPSMEQVVRWFNDGLLLLTKLLPDERLAWAQHSIVIDNVGSELHLEGSNIIRLGVVTKYNFQAHEVGHQMLMSMRSKMPNKASVQTPYFCRFGSEGKVRLKFLPESSGKVHVNFVRMPTAYFWNNDGDQWTPDAYSAPAELEPFLVDYVVLQGKIQDEEPQQFQMLYQAWMQSLQIESQAITTGVEE